MKQEMLSSSCLLFAMVQVDKDLIQYLRQAEEGLSTMLLLVLSFFGWGIVQIQSNNSLWVKEGCWGREGGGEKERRQNLNCLYSTIMYRLILLHFSLQFYLFCSLFLLS